METAIKYGTVGDVSVVRSTDDANNGFIIRFRSFLRSVNNRRSGMDKHLINGNDVIPGTLVQGTSSHKTAATRAPLTFERPVVTISCTEAVATCYRGFTLNSGGLKTS